MARAVRGGPDRRTTGLLRTLPGGFEITAAARRRDPALAQSVERTLWERFNKNADNLRRAVKQAGKTQQRISL